MHGGGEVFLHVEVAVGVAGSDAGGGVAEAVVLDGFEDLVLGHPGFGAVA